jgi:hypothetical protein
VHLAIKQQPPIHLTFTFPKLQAAQRSKATSNDVSLLRRRRSVDLPNAWDLSSCPRALKLSTTPVTISVGNASTGGSCFDILARVWAQDNYMDLQLACSDLKL